MRSSGPARVLAPLALIAVVVAVLLIVRSGDAGSTASDTPATATTTTSSSGTTTTRRRSRPRTYTVRSNDTLSAIAERTGVSVSRLQSLNPDVDAGALQTGQRLKLTG